MNSGPLFALMMTPRGTGCASAEGGRPELHATVTGCNVTPRVGIALRYSCVSFRIVDHCTPRVLKTPPGLERHAVPCFFFRFQ